jgi:hypothetical protein
MTAVDELSFSCSWRLFFQRLPRSKKSIAARSELEFSLSMTLPAIHRLHLRRLRGFQNLAWHPQIGVNVILEHGNPS